MLNSDMDILVVDDAPAMRQIICSLMQELGLKKVREAKDGSMALQTWPTHPLPQCGNKPTVFRTSVKIDKY